LSSGVHLDSQTLSACFSYLYRSFFSKALMLHGMPAWKGRATIIASFQKQ
jgi:hypothetical protein